MTDAEEGATAGVSETPSQDNSPLVKDVFSMFKSYLEVRLDEKGKQIETQ